MIHLYKLRIVQAQKECSCIAAKLWLRTENRHQLKQSYLRCKRKLETSERIMRDRFGETLQGIVAHLRMIRICMERRDLDTGPVDLILSCIEKAKYTEAAQCIRYFQPDCMDELEETSMYLHSTNWYKTKFYYYKVLNN